MYGYNSKRSGGYTTRQPQSARPVEQKIGARARTIQISDDRQSMPLNGDNTAYIRSFEILCSTRQGQNKVMVPTSSIVAVQREISFAQQRCTYHRHVALLVAYSMADLGSSRRFRNGCIFDRVYSVMNTTSAFASETLKNVVNYISLIAVQRW